MGQTASQPSSPNLEARALPPKEPNWREASLPLRPRSQHSRRSFRTSTYEHAPQSLSSNSRSRPPLVRADTSTLPAASPEWGQCSDSNEEFGGLKILVAGRRLSTNKLLKRISLEQHIPTPDVLDVQIDHVDSTYLPPPTPEPRFSERASPKSHWSESSVGEETPPMPFHTFRNSMAFSLNSKRYSTLSANPRQSTISDGSGSSGPSRPASAAFLSVEPPIERAEISKSEKENRRFRKASLKKAKKRGGIVIVGAERLGSQRYSTLQQSQSLPNMARLSKGEEDLTVPDVSASAQARRRAEARVVATATLRSSRRSQSKERPVTFIATSPDLENLDGGTQDFDYMPVPRPLVSRLPQGHPAAHHDRFKTAGQSDLVQLEQPRDVLVASKRQQARQSSVSPSSFMVKSDDVFSHERDMTRAARPISVHTRSGGRAVELITSQDAAAYARLPNFVHHASLHMDLPLPTSSTRDVDSNDTSDTSISMEERCTQFETEAPERGYSPDASRIPDALARGTDLDTHSPLSGVDKPATSSTHDLAGSPVRLESPFPELDGATVAPAGLRTPPNFAGFSFSRIKATPTLPSPRPDPLRLVDSSVIAQTELTEKVLPLTPSTTGHSESGPERNRFDSYDNEMSFATATAAAAAAAVSRALPRYSTVEFPSSPPLVPYESQPRRGTFPQWSYERDDYGHGTRQSKNQAFDALVNRARADGPGPGPGPEIGSRLGSSRKRGFERNEIQAWLSRTQSVRLD